MGRTQELDFSFDRVAFLLTMLGIECQIDCWWKLLYEIIDIKFFSRNFCQFGNEGVHYASLVMVYVFMNILNH